ncbi:MAG TPA: methyltransferase domain-containing protein [Gemmatimonadales bacterium]|nr:methyltransferase domain-containing protein [Gemmatimonadales bacterium]
MTDAVPLPARVDPAAWAPHGAALRAYMEGDQEACLVVEDDFQRELLPVSVFFRTPEAFFPYEVRALELCRGRVLDAGAGTGCISLVLQERGHQVVAIDVVPEAVEIMRARGVHDARQADLFALRDEQFDTVLLLMNGLGLAGTVAGLPLLLQHLHRLVAPGGQVLVDSTDVATAPPPAVPPGRYPGELQFRLEFAERRGVSFPQLYADPALMERHARDTGWRSDVVFRGEHGSWLARLERL